MNVDDIVGREIFYCATSIVTHIISEDEYGDYCDLEEKMDYIEPIMDEFNQMETKDKFLLLIENNIIDEDNEVEEDNLYDILEEALEDEDVCPIDLCDEMRLNPYVKEVFEYWIVSGWLASKLSDLGEVVDEDFFGLTIWGRSTMGQLISMDEVIKRIAKES